MAREIPALLREIMRHTGMSQKELAVEIDVSQGTISKLLSGQHRPELATFERIERLADRVTGDRGHSMEARSSLTGAPSVPEIDARAGAGMGSVGEERVVNLGNGHTVIGQKVVAEWSIPESFLRHELRASPAKIIVLEVVGDSMMPTLQPGDRIFVDYSHSKPSPDGLYLVDEGYGPMVKRLQIVRRSDPIEIEIISDNPLHRPIIQRLDDVTVMGRVVGKITRL